MNKGDLAVIQRFHKNDQWGKEYRKYFENATFKFDPNNDCSGEDWVFDMKADQDKFAEAYLKDCGCDQAPKRFFFHPGTMLKPIVKQSEIEKVLETEKSKIETAGELMDMVGIQLRNVNVPGSERKINSQTATILFEIADHVKTTSGQTMLKINQMMFVIEKSDESSKSN